MVDESEPVWHRFVRFIAEDGLQYCGQPENDDLDVGLAMLNKVPVMVDILDVESSLDGDASFTGEKRQILELLSPISTEEAGAIQCIGLNYTDHAAEMKVATPDYPEVFLKPATTISTATAPIVIPKTCQNQVDGEVELAIVIGEDCKDLTLDNAMESVLGYTVANDVTARKFQARGSQWGFSKGFDTFCPLGPVLVSKQWLPDPSALELKTTLNGKLMQNGLAKNMIFSIEQILVYLSSGHTLKKGTVILTGTPSGIGASYDPPIYLQRGADLKVSISHGLGTLVNPVV
ncbi:hypothetical protein D6D01_03490 [Aureobasidium pullulans]|uniref:Fumarylacetoacetase-like C-terminal domain-containing protein n=1 Tax=Aureobasidium pullulans TaxID=5580 RepID=A0A4S9LKJ1_AURPU|nr:hypothetical protein D6D01_03490 [Aureobasidium pullulans]